MALLTITGTGYANYVYVQVGGGTKYSSATTLTVDDGTLIYVKVYGYTQSSYISVNGENVASGLLLVEFTFNISADTTIQLQDEQSGSFAKILYNSFTGDTISGDIVYCSFDSEIVDDLDTANVFATGSNASILDNALFLNGNTYLTIDMGRNYAKTISCWFKATNNIGASYRYPTLFSTSSYSTNGGTYVHVSNPNNNIVCRVNSANSTANNGSAITSTSMDSEWHHFAMCNSGSTYYFFLDGLKINTLTQSNPNEVNIIYIGMKMMSTGVDANTYFYGYIDDLRISSECLWSNNFTPPARNIPSLEEPQLESVINFNYSGSVQTHLLLAGTYKIECWGAQGGSYQTQLGGNGGYSYGTIQLTEDTNIFVYVGGLPDTSTKTQSVVRGGFNGGGNGFNRNYSSVYTYGQGGGGASDVRIGSDSLYARVIVAGGGGGSALANDTNKHGGGTTGGSGTASATASYVAKQTAPTTSGRYQAGTFGQGASATTQRSNYLHGSGGGGGGWYGGYAYNYAADNQTSYCGWNGGGSGYVYTESTEQYYPSGKLLTSKYYLTDAETIGGNTSFKSPSGSNETGHTGNGFVRITRLDAPSQGQLFIKIGTTYKQVTKVYKKQGNAWVELNEVLPYFQSKLWKYVK